jgi:DNA-binding NarL/FixJ family response regulator
MQEQTEEKRIRLVLLDDHGLFRASLGCLLASEPDFEVAGECGTSAEALEILKHSGVDIILLDFDLGSERGSEFISAVRKAGYQGRFLIVTGAPDARRSALALKLGASGIFLKSEAPDRLVQAIRLVAKGDVWVDQKVIQLLADQLVDRHPQPEDHGFDGPFGDRERKVLLGILGGLTNKKIGDNMGLSESSVKNLVQRLFAKAGVKTRSQLVRVALEGSLGRARQVMRRHSKEMTTASQSHG